MPSTEVDPAIASFNAALDRSLQRLEEAAAIAAGEIASEVDESARSVGDPANGRLIEGFGHHFSEYAAGIAEACERIRAEISTGATATGEEEKVHASKEASQGAKMLILQMAAAGADVSEIETRLTAFGMEYQREMIEGILADPLA